MLTNYSKEDSENRILMGNKLHRTVLSQEETNLSTSTQVINHLKIVATL